MGSGTGREQTRKVALRSYRFKQHQGTKSLRHFAKLYGRQRRRSWPLAQADIGDYEACDSVRPPYIPPNFATSAAHRVSCMLILKDLRAKAKKVNGI